MRVRVEQLGSGHAERCRGQRVNRLENLIGRVTVARPDEPPHILLRGNGPIDGSVDLYIRRLWLRRENEGVHRDCYSNERMRGLKRVLVK